MMNDDRLRVGLGAENLGKIDADPAACDRLGMKERFHFGSQYKNAATMRLNHPDDFNTGPKQQISFG